MWNENRIKIPGKGFFSTMQIAIFRRTIVSVTWLCDITGPFYLFPVSWLAHLSSFHPHKAFCLSLKDIQQLLQLQQLVLMPGHPLQSPAQFLLPQAQAQQGQQGKMRLFTHYFIMAMGSVESLKLNHWNTPLPCVCITIISHNSWLCDTYNICVQWCL